VSKTRKTRLVRDIERCLKKTGLPWSLVAGKKHWQIVLNGEVVGVLSYGIQAGMDGRNLMSIIEKKAKGC
jgi:hypothetical protein